MSTGHANSERVRADFVTAVCVSAAASGPVAAIALFPIITPALVFINGETFSEAAHHWLVLVWHVMCFHYILLVGHIIPLMLLRKFAISRPRVWIPLFFVPLVGFAVLALPEWIQDGTKALYFYYAWLVPFLGFIAFCSGVIIWMRIAARRRRDASDLTASGEPG